MELADRIAIITAASSGIGEATACELDAAGMRLVLNAGVNQQTVKQLTVTQQSKTYSKEYPNG